MNYEESAQKLLQLWLNGQRIKFFRMFNAFPQYVALAVMSQFMLALMDHDKNSGYDGAVPRFIEAMENYASDKNARLVMDIMEE